MGKIRFFHAEHDSVQLPKRMPNLHYVISS